MATAAQIQYTVTLPAVDVPYFSETIKRNKWKLTPFKVQKNKVVQFTPEQLAIIEMARKLDAKIDKNVPKMTMQEIVKEIKDCRNGK